MELFQSVGFNGNGYLELPAQYLRYDQLEVGPEVIALAFHTNYDGVLLYQKEAALTHGGDFIMIRGISLWNNIIKNKIFQSIILDKV